MKTILIIQLVLCGSLIAQEADSTVTRRNLLKLSLKDLMNVDVVTASRKEQKFSEAPANVIVISAETIEQRGYQTLTEVFEDLPGFDFTTKQPAGEFPAQNIFRGLTDAGQTKMLLMVDGIVQNDISNGWMNNVSYDFPMEDIERIELISGPGSSLYGANAYAGLINVITKDPFKNHDEESFLEAKLLYGANNTISPELFAGYRFENGLTLQLAGRLFMSDGDRGIDRYDPAGYFHNNYEPDSVFTTEHGNIANERTASGLTKKLPDGFGNDIKDVSFRGKITKEGFTLGFSYWNKEEGLGSSLVGYEYFGNTDGIDYLAAQKGYYIYSGYDTQLSKNVFSKTLFYHRNTSIAPSTGFTYTYKYQSVNNGIDSPVIDKKKAYSGEGFETRIEQQVNIDLEKNHSMIFGFLFEQRNEEYYGMSIGPEQDGRSTIVNSTYDSGLRTVQPVYFINNAAVYVQDDYRFSDSYKLTAGFRYDYNSQFKGIINPRVALVANPVKNLTVKLLYGHAHKAPTVFELFDEWHGNNELKPQKIQTSEIELRYFLNDNINLSFDYYYSNLDNLINIVENPDPTYVIIGPNGEHETYYQNVGSTNLSGYTISLDHFINKELRYHLDYTNTIGENGNEIANTAWHKLNFSINYSLWDKLNINLRGNFVGKVSAPSDNLYFYPKTPETVSQVGYDYVIHENPDGYIPNHFVTHLTLRGTNLFGEGFNLEPELIIRNLFDTEYYTPGRQLLMAVRPVNEIQASIQNPVGYNPAYHPQPGREIIFRLVYKL